MVGPYTRRKGKLTLGKCTEQEGVECVVRVARTPRGEVCGNWVAHERAEKGAAGPYTECVVRAARTPREGEVCGNEVAHGTSREMRGVGVHKTGEASAGLS